MKAAVLEKLNCPLVINPNIEIPKLKKGQVLVKMKYSGVCGSQLMEQKGLRGEDKYLPHMLGHEGSGVVEQIGENVRKVKVGDKLILSWIKGTGADAGGSLLSDDKGVVNAGPVTTFSEYSVVSENRCFPLPEQVPMDIAVLLGCAVPTGCGIVIKEIKPCKENSIAIFGLGGIGLGALIAAKMFNCKRIIAVDVEKSKLNKAVELGATHTVNALEEDSYETIFNITKGKGVDFSVDATGVIDSIEKSFNVVRKNGGLCICASHPKKGDKISIDPFDLISGKQIKGSWGGSCKPDTDIPFFANLYTAGKLPIDKLLDKRYTLDNINKALEDLNDRKITRALIEIEKS